MTREPGPDTQSPPPPAGLKALAGRFQHSWAGQLVGRFIEHDVLALAAALSFYTTLSLAPLVVLVLWVTTALYPAAQEEFFRQVGLLVGPEVEATTRLIVDNAQSQPGVGSFAAIIGTGALLFSASIVFAQLQTALNRVFHSSAQQLGGLWAWLRKRLLSLGIVLGIGFLLVVSMAVQAALSLLTHWLPDLLPVVVAGFSFLLYTLVFAAMYRLLPDCPVSRKRAFLGGALTAAMFMLGRWLIGLYLGQASLGSAYGPAGGLMVMLVWLYYCAVIFLVGALITALLEEHADARAERHSGAPEPAGAAPAGPPPPGS
ncbi:YihY/virulence factor BrkB family protein [Lysobacter sp. GX 14042]|uniref:YihY/virulence factor BrkB family protein n=1 Tax=Lysobacter sp. GX 14042 TaxID=2907155 RepID=UPI001F43235D|nr:YihY/virulence factor BrkB family protein [Lysobacter sp. GX 14042]MCE7033433.1 YihY/virulence factor BrkB family protein [Lysobacter sp. GX 14042]